ncbi:MAG: OmpH family outer membrane protein [Planctomycetaceae bacterium]|nr:OmpH family outer membrane protein [Planctomycetaceae bacterium]
MLKSSVFFILTVSCLLVESSLSAWPPPPPPRPELPAPPSAQEEAIELTRGPVHEAFAQPYEMKSGGDFIVTQVPPEPIDEVPPMELPASPDFQWVGGYWGWEPDEERFVWISGLWRRAPEGRIWNPGYWVEVEGGFTWVSGSWIKEGEAYLISQIPPDAREENPGEPPSPIHFWVPGHWLETSGGFTWNPGFWSRGYEGRVWIPFRYQWTPQGYLALNGYWDYALEDRGVLYSPVAFNQIPPPSYRYSPTLVTRIDYLPTHLFIYRNYGHYCFGDYYGFRRPGIFISWTSRNYRYYDPLRFFFLTFHRDRFNHYRNRHDYYHDHADFRPRHTWREQRQFVDRWRDRKEFDRDNLRDAVVATGFSDVLKGENVGTRIHFDEKNQNRQRWDEIVRQNVRTRESQKRYEQNLKKLGKIQPGKERFPIENRTRIGPLQIETKQKPSFKRSGRVGDSGKGITITPGREPRTDGNSRFPSNNRDPRVNQGKSRDSDALKKLRDQTERMRREAEQKSKKNDDDRRRKAIQQFQDRQRDLQQKNQQREALQKEMQRRQEIQKKQAEEQAKRRPSESRRFQGRPNSQSRRKETPPPKQEFKQPQRRDSEPKRSESKRPEPKQPEVKRPPSSSSQKSKGSSSQSKGPQRRSSGSKKKDD